MEWRVGRGRGVLRGRQWLHDCARALLCAFFCSRVLLTPLARSPMPPHRTLACRRAHAWRRSAGSGCACERPYGGLYHHECARFLCVCAGARVGPVSAPSKDRVGAHECMWHVLCLFGFRVCGWGYLFIHYRSDASTTRPQRSVLHLSTLIQHHAIATRLLVASRNVSPSMTRLPSSFLCTFIAASTPTSCTLDAWVVCELNTSMSLKPAPARCFAVERSKVVSPWPKTRWVAERETCHAAA